MRRSTWLIFAPVAILALLPSAVRAEPVSGLTVIGYSIDAIPPVQSDDVYPVCGQGTLEFINATWDYVENEFGQCGGDLFMLHYSGSITIPAHDTIQFWLASDDGGTVQIGSQSIGRWSDSGCSISYEGAIDISAGTYPIDAWFYENGGGTCFMLAWNIDDSGWTIVPPEAFSGGSEIVPTTTTTTTVMEVATTALPPTTQATPSSTTTASSQATSTTITTTTSTTTTTTLPPTTTTSTTTLPPTTTTTTEPVPDTTVPDSIYIDETTTTLEPVTTTTEPKTTTTTEPVPDSTVPDTTLPEPSEPETTTTTEPETEPDGATPEQIIALMADVQTLTHQEPATVLPDQITEIINSPAFDSLTDDQLAEIADIISDAPDETKVAFENALNIFSSDAYGEYVPVGSIITVAQRRSIIAVGIVMALPTPVPVSRRRA